MLTIPSGVSIRYSPDTICFFFFKRSATPRVPPSSPPRPSPVLADPGCLRACPADGAIVQYSNGIVDFNQENCIGCEFCVSGCPFNIPKFNPTTKKVYKCTL